MILLVASASPRVRVAEMPFAAADSTGYETLSTKRKNPFNRSVGYGAPEPSRFVDGVSFKGKLIGVLEVEAARGDRMCQEALAELKGAVRAAGEHKQRIAVTVAMDGIRLRDDRTGDCLYHHPVHKISFIAQDMTDTRAFGYIFGSPDAGHKFFGIKTEKTASQVVIAMRDLFQVVFEMKKKEIEKARSQLEEGRDGADFKEEKPFDPFGDSFRPASVASSSASGSGGKAGLAVGGSATLPSSAASASKARLPSSSSGGSAVSISNVPPPLAPPPLSGRSRHDSAHSRHHHVQQQSSQQHSIGSDSEHLAFATKFPVDFNNMTRPGAQSVPPHDVHEDRYAVFKEVRPASDESLNDFKGGGFGTSSRLAVSHEAVDSGHSRTGGEFGDEWSLNDLAGTSVTSESDVRTGSNYDVFTELDPLGTGKIRPFVDKKDFFNDVRKQTKRLLRELGDGEDSHPGSPRTQPAGVIPTEVSVLVASTSLYSSAGHPYTSTEAINTQQSASQNAPSSTTSTTPMHMSAIASHSFSESYSPPHDSYEDYRAHQSTTDQQLQQFETPVSGFADFNRFSGESPRSQRSEMSSSSMPEEPPPQLPVGALTVALPPESFRDSPPSFSPPPPPPQQQTPGQSPQPQKRLLKQMTVHAGGVSPKTLPRSHKFGKQTSVEGDWDAPGQHEDQRQFELPISLAEEDYGGGLACPVSSESISTGGVSPRPRPRSSLSKHLSVSSATLPLRQPHRFERKYSHDQNFEQLYDHDQKYIHDKKFDMKYNHEQFSSPEAECRPFPNDDLELTYDQAPAPPPRPAPIEPPPLPPKRQPTHVTLRPPPRPPTSSAEAHYFYINDKYDTPPEDANSTSPPIPLPSRKPRYSDLSQPSSVPDRATKPSFVSEQPFHFPRPNISPTHDASSTGAIPKLALSSRDSTPSKTSTPSGKSPRTGKRPSTGSIDLTNTSLDQLAAKLEIPVEQLAKMTVVELAACLAQMQLKQDGSDSHHDADDTTDSCGSHTARSGSGEGRAPHPSYRDRSQERRGSSSRERMKFDEEEEFARFDAQFPVSPVNTPEFPLTLETTEQQSLGAPVSEDRYAVFRELTVTPKHKSVFDENFLTPQNSMEDEASEISSGTFKVNFVPPDFRQDSMDQKSSLSDDLDHERDHKHWSNAGVNEDEGVTVFRSPDISEYENFEPNFEAKFDEDLNTADKHSLDMVEVAALRSPASQKLSTDSGKSPFTDDFSCVSQEEIVRTLNATKSSSESLGKFDDDFVPPVESQEDKYAVLRELVLAETPQKAKSSTSSKSPFDNNFVEKCPKEVNVLDSGFLSTAEDKFDDVFQESEVQKDDVPEEPHSRKCSANPDADSLNNPQEDNDSFNKSPFDDDFTNRSDRYEVLKEVESEREPSVEGEIGSQEGAGQAKSVSSPFDGSWHGSNRNASYDDTNGGGESPQTVREEESRKRNSTSNNIYHEGAVSFDDRSRNFNDNNRESPYEDCLGGSRDTSLEMNNGFYRSASDRQKSGSGIAVGSRKRSMSSDPERQASRSPYSEGGVVPSHTPSYTDSIARRRCNSHGPSRLSVGSEGSGDARLSQQSPFDDNFNSVAGSVAEEVHFESAFPSLQPLPDNFTDDANSLNDPFANEKVGDAFVSENNSAFADFEQAFHQAEKSNRGIDSVKEMPRTPNPSFDVAEEAVFPDSNVEFRVSARFAQQTQQGVPSKDEDPDDIFRRNSDPFADDFFSEDLKDSGSSDNAQTEGGNATTWQEPFEVFNFSQNSTK